MPFFHKVTSFWLLGLLEFSQGAVYNKPGLDLVPYDWAKLKSLQCGPNLIFNFQEVKWKLFQTSWVTVNPEGNTLSGRDENLFCPTSQPSQPDVSGDLVTVKSYNNYECPLFARGKIWANSGEVSPCSVYVATKFVTPGSECQHTYPDGLCKALFEDPHDIVYNHGHASGSRSSNNDRGTSVLAGPPRGGDNTP